MDIVNGHTDHEKSCTPLQAMHVYQHVNSENLESSATPALQAAFLKGISEGMCSPHDTATHEQQSALTSNLGKSEVR
jgi:rhamnogalacturonyl hydrolase YesR